MIEARRNDGDAAMTCDARRRMPAGRDGLNATLIAALLCLLWQAVVVRTHLHLPFDMVQADVVPVGAGHAARASDGKHHPKPAGPADCPICQQHAQAGVYLVPTPIVLDTPEAVAIWQSNPPSPASLSVMRSHAWQSRAPPRRFLS